MGTRIHNGWRFAPSSGIADVFALAELLRAHVTPHVEALYTAATVQRAVTALDVATVAGEPSPAAPLAVAARELDAEGKESRRTMRRSTSDFSVEIAIMEDPPDRSSLYLLVFSDQDLDDALVGAAGVERFGFWTSSDRPDDVTASEWARREQLWDRVVGWRRPVECGVSWRSPDVDATLVLDPSRVDAVVAQVPSLERRAMRVVSHEYDAALVLPKGADPGDTRAWFAAAQEALLAARADTSRRDEVASMLSEISWEDLVGVRGRGHPTTTSV